MSKANLVALHLRSRAWWRLDSAGATAVQVARSVVALLDAVAYLRDVPDDDPDIRALDDVPAPRPVTPSGATSSGAATARTRR